jgi:hypothetical protein
MRTIHYSANSVLPNTTGAVGVQVLDVHEAEPTVSLVPILGWALADGIEPQPLFMMNKHCDAIYDPTTGHVHTQYGECWSSLEEAVPVLAHANREALKQAPAKADTVSAS